MIANAVLLFPGRSGEGGFGERARRERLCGFGELLSWGHAKLLKATSGIWAPCPCLFLTSQAWVVVRPGLLRFMLLLRFGGRKAAVRTEDLDACAHPPPPPIPGRPLKCASVCLGLGVCCEENEISCGFNLPPRGVLSF